MPEDQEEDEDHRCSRRREEECLVELRRILEEKVEVCTVPMDATEFLLRFARVKKYDTAKAAKMLASYLEWRRQSETRYGYALVPSSVKSVLVLGMINVLKERDPWGRQVFVFRTDLWDPMEVSLDEIIVSSILVLDGMTESEETQKNGVVLVADMTGLRFRHVVQGTPSRVLRILAVLQGNYPVRCAGLHAVNEPRWLQRVLSFAKPFFSEKLQKRVHFHGKDYESLHKLIPRGILPRALGGTQPEWDDVVDSDFVQRLFEKEEDFAKWKQLVFR